MLSVFTAAISERKGALTPERVLLFLVACLSVLHLLVAGRVALSVDEAHYALYGQFPAWSYFDHPPLVGWLQALVLPFSHDESALRLWPVTLAALSSFLLYRLARVLFPDESPWVAVAAVALLQSAVLFQVVSLGLVPEDPLLFFGLAAALAFHRLLNGGSGWNWLWLGASLGFAGLSKYTAVLLPLSMLLVLIVERRTNLLAAPAPWLSAGLALALVLPVFWWNAHHDWISLSYQWEHGAPERSWRGAHLLVSMAGQLLAYGPALVLLASAAAFASLRRWGVHAGARFSLLFAAPVLLVFFVSAGHQEALPHWTLLGWAFLAPLAARWIVQHWNSRSVKAIVAVGTVYSLTLTVVIHTQFLQPWIPFSPYKHPLADLYGWREAGVRAAELRAEGTQPLMVANWTQASRIAWYAAAPVMVLDRGIDQFDLWFGTPERGASGLLILVDEKGREALRKFDNCMEKDRLSTSLGSTPVHTFHYFDCHGYRGHS